jgi:hypothetical protein
MSSSGLSGHIEAVQAQLKWDLSHRFESGVFQECPHLERRDAINFARSHSASSLFILSKQHMRDATGPRANHGCQEDAARTQDAFDVEKSRLTIRDVVERGHHTDRVEGLIAKRQPRRVLDPDVDTFPGKHVGTGTASVGADEIVIAASQVEKTPTDEREHDAEPPALERIHPAYCEWAGRSLVRQAQNASIGPPIGMTWSPTSARLITIGRRALPWLVGPTVLFTEGRMRELVPPHPCPGLLELASIVALRTRVDLTVGVWFSILHALAIVIGLAAFVTLARRVTGNTAVAASTGLAIGLSPAFPRTLALPREAVAFAVCACGAVLFARSLNRHANPAVSPRWFPVVVAWLVAALVVPEWTIGAALGAGITFCLAVSGLGRTGRYVGGCVSALFCVLLVLTMFAVSPGIDGGTSSLSPWRALAACSTPAWRQVGLTALFGWLLGPFALALAALGLVAEVQTAGWRRCLKIMAAGLAGLALVGITPSNAPEAVIPWLLGVWMLAAVGFQQVVSLARSSATRVIAALLLALCPILQIARLRAEERDDWVHSLGHEAATLRHVIAVLNVVPANATFAEEDATIDLLMRAAVFGGRRAGKPFTIATRRRDIIKSALDRGPVYAFPRGQEDLSERGFVLEPVPRIGRSRDDSDKTVDGLAAITGTRPCQVVGERWVDLAGIGATGRIAMSGESESAYGPIVLYLGGPMAGEPRPDGWPLRATRGFWSATFDRDTEPHADRLQAEGRARELSDHEAFASPYVTRLTLHRTPRAPLTLGILLGASRPVGVAKGEYFDRSPISHLTICEAPPVKIGSIS